MSTIERRIRTTQGEIFVTDFEGVGVPVVLMHGFPDHHRIYDRLMAALTPRRALAFDFLGYGRSARGTHIRQSFGAHEHQIESVLDASGITRAVLVGHDASGPDAVRFAIEHPDRISHLVLLNTVFGHRPGLIMPEMTRLFAEPTLRALADDLMADEEKRAWMLGRWGAQWELNGDDPGSLAWTSIMPQFFGGDEQPDALTAIRDWTAELLLDLDDQEKMVESGALKTVDAPVSIIFGERDRYLTPSLAREIAQLFRHAELHLIEEAGHYPQHDRADLVARLVTEPTTA